MAKWTVLRNTITSAFTSLGLTSGWPVFGAGGAALTAHQPRGNTTVAQMASSTANPTSGHLASFDANGNTQDSGVPAAIMTTKGDLLAFGTAISRLGIGTNGLVLTADSTQTLGLKWATATGAGLSAASVKTGSYTAVLGDLGALLAMNSASAQTITLPAAPPSSTWCVFVQNIGAGVLTVSRNGLTIDAAAANLTIYTGQGVIVFTDGTNYFTERGMGFSLNMPAVSHQFLTAYNAATGQFSQAQPADADLSISDITTNNVSTAAHGFAPKSPGSAAVYLDGTGAYSTPSGVAGGVNAQTASYTAVSGDSGKLITFSSPAVLTLPTTPPSSTWAVHVENASAGSVSIATAATAYPAGWTPRQAAGAGTTGGNAGECLDETAATAATYSVTVTANTACYIQSVLCALKPSGSSAPAYVQGSATETGYTGHSYASASYASANAAGNCLICDVWFQSNSALVGTVSVTDTNGNTWSLVAGSAGVTYMAGGVTAYSGTWVSPNCAGGANAVTVSNGGLLVEQTFIGLHEYSGVPTSSPIDVSHQTNSSTAVTTVSPSVTTTGTNRILHLFGAMYGNYLTLGAQLDGANASLLLGVNQGLYIATDGTNYFSERGVGGGSSTATPTATTALLGVVKPDGVTIDVAAGVISVPAATSSLLGLVKPDGVTIANAAGAISVPTATTSALGLVKPDGTSVTVAAGVISAAQATGSTFGTVKPDNTTVTISSGVISAVGGGGGGGGGTTIGGGGASTVIAQQTLTSPSASIAFSSIPASYAQLILVFTTSSSTAATTDDIWMQFNGDTGSNYSNANIYSNAVNTTIASYNSASTATPDVATVTGATSSCLGGTGTITIPGYALTAFSKTAICTSAANAVTSGKGVQNHTNTMVWTNTAAINSLVLALFSGANFIAGSTFTLYGISGTAVPTTSTQVAALIQQTTGQAIPNNATTQVTFGTTVRDDGGFTAGAANALTAPYTGWYNVSAGLQWASGAMTLAGLTIYVNGSEPIGGTLPRSQYGGGGYGANSTSGILHLNSGDVITAWAYQNNGSSVSATQAYLAAICTATGVIANPTATAGTFASLPGSPSAGQMYLFTNSIYDSALYQTSAWIYLKDGKQMTPPTGFAWMNQSTATLTTANGGENLLGAVGGAANNVNCRYVAYPTVPFTRTVAMRQSNMSTLGHQASNAIAGLFLSDGTKMEIFGLIGQGPSIGLQTGPTVNNINANVTGPTLTAVPSSNLIWYRVDDGVTASGKRTFFVSFDGIQFIQVYQESNTQYLTPTRIGYFVSAYETGTYSAAWVLHWA